MLINKGNHIMLEVSHLTKYFGAHCALDDIHFTAEDGVVLGLLGPNGAGKSTLMNIISGCLMPSAGRVSLDGVDIVADAALARARVGYLPERPPLHQLMTVAEYLSFAADLRGADRAQPFGRAGDVLGRLALKSVRGRLIGNLSKGYQQRIGLAAALIGDPACLILDEPTSGLDPLQARDFRRLLSDIRADRIILFSTHILSEVEAVTDRVVILHQGRCLTDGLNEPPAGDRIFLLIVAEAGKAMLQMLRKIDGVTDIRVLKTSGPAAADGNEPPGAETEVLLTVKAETVPGSFQRRLFFTMARHNWPILELRPMDSALTVRFFETVQRIQAEEVHV